jgi:GNAT superfamily N-acetyltransferase
MPTIRSLQAADRVAWLELWRGYQAFYRASIAEAVTTRTFERLLDPAEPMHAAVATDDSGQPFGMVHFITHRSCWTEGDYCYLQDLFVTPSARGSGAGRALIEHVYAQAQELGCSRVYWLTHETNTDAMALYDKVAERSGFIQYRKAL